MADTENQNIIHKKIRGIGETKSYLECFIPPYVSISDMAGYFLLSPFSIVLNMYYILHNFIILHTEYNDANSKYNARYLKLGNNIVVHVEFIGLILLIFSIIVSYVTHYDSIVIDCIKHCGSWSAFQLFYEFRPKSLMNYYSTCFSHHVTRLNQTSIKNYKQCKSLKQKILTEMQADNSELHDLNKIMKETLDKLDEVIDNFEKTHDFSKENDKNHQAETLPIGLLSTMIVIASWIAFILVSTTLLLVGMMFLLMKLAQFSYLNDADVKLTSYEFLNTVWLFIAFCNQLWNICDIDAIKKDTIYKFVFMQQNAKFTRHIADTISAFDSTIKQTLWNTFGIKGLLLATGMDSKFLHRLIVQDDCDNFNVRDLIYYNENSKSNLMNHQIVEENANHDNDMSEHLLKFDDDIKSNSDNSVISDPNSEHSESKWKRFKHLVSRNNEWIRMKMKSFSDLVKLQKHQQPIHPYIEGELIVTRYQQKTDCNKPFELFTKQHRIFIPGKCAQKVKTSINYLAICKFFVFVSNVYADIAFFVLLCVINSKLFIPAVIFIMLPHILSISIGLLIIHKANQDETSLIRTYRKSIIALCVSTGFCSTLQLLSVLFPMDDAYNSILFMEKIRFYVRCVLQNIPLMILQFAVLIRSSVSFHAVEGAVTVIALCLSLVSLFLGVLSLRSKKGTQSNADRQSKLSEITLQNHGSVEIDDFDDFKHNEVEKEQNGENITFNSYSLNDIQYDAKLIIKTNIFTNIAAMFEKIELLIKWVLPMLVMLSFITSWLLSILSVVNQSNDWTLNQKLSKDAFYQWHHIWLLFSFLVTSTVGISFMPVCMSAILCCYESFKKWTKVILYAWGSFLVVSLYFAVIIVYYFQTNDNNTISNIIHHSSTPNYYYYFLVSNVIFVYSLASILALLSLTVVIAAVLIWWIEILSFLMLFSFVVSRFYFITIGPIFSVIGDVIFLTKIDPNHMAYDSVGIIVVASHICWVIISVIHYYKHQLHANNFALVDNKSLLKKWDRMYLIYLMFLLTSNIAYLVFIYANGNDIGFLERVCWENVISLAVVLITIKIKGKDLVTFAFDLNWVREWILLSSAKTTINDPEKQEKYFK